MSFYNTETLPNFSNRDPLVRLASQLENTKRFTINSFGNANNSDISYVIVPESATNPATPYMLTLEQQCNPGFFLELADNPGAFDGSGNLIYGNMKTYYIQSPYGYQSALNPYFGPLDLKYDVDLWQAWKATFGFDKIPIGFYIGFTVQIGLGTQAVFTFGTPNLNFPIVRENPANYIPGIGIAPRAFGYNFKFSQFYTQLITSAVYTELSDADFATYYPKEYNTPAAALVQPVLRPGNAQV